MIDNNLLLYLPFDDPDGRIAYDHSVGRKDAYLAGDINLSVNARVGKSLQLGTGTCTTRATIPFDTDFTVCAYVMAEDGILVWLLNFSGIDNYIEQTLDVAPQEWHFIAFVRQGEAFYVYLNNERVFVGNIEGNPIGFSLNTPQLLSTTASLDEVRIYDVAKTANEIIKIQADSDVEYFVDGVNLKDFGVSVSASSGLIGRLAQKESLTVDYDNYHGIVRDHGRKRYKERTIQLDCFLEASSRKVFIEQQSRFFSLFDGNGTHRLKVMYDGNSKPLVYEVQLKDEIEVTKRWAMGKNDSMAGTFKIKLVEDEPVKRVLRHISAVDNSVAAILVASDKHLNIYWGDGTHTFNVHGENVSVEHTYSKPGEYDIIISGVIEDIGIFETNEIVIWDLLK